MSFEQDLLFDMDLDFDYNKNITNSVVFKKNKQNDLSTSLNSFTLPRIETSLSL